MVSVLATSVEGHGFNPGFVKPKTLKFEFCCFSDKHAAFRGKNKGWSAQSQNNVGKVACLLHTVALVS